MKIHLHELSVRTRRTTEIVPFGESVTFIHGPVSTGKSSVARLIDYCFGGEVERTPAIRKEFISVQLNVTLGIHRCVFERSADDLGTVRVTWTTSEAVSESVNAPIDAREGSILNQDIYNLSDLIYYLCGVQPIKVRARSRDGDSNLIRLGFRDLWSFCYLEQTHLDSSFFHNEESFRWRKSQDAMRFFTGLHSEQLDTVQNERAKLLDEQRAQRQAVQQVHAFMERFEIGSEKDIHTQITTAKEKLALAENKRKLLEEGRSSDIHPSDPLRMQLRRLGSDIENLTLAISESVRTMDDQKALRAEFITGKVKSIRSQLAGSVLSSVDYKRCPKCGQDLEHHTVDHAHCGLCKNSLTNVNQLSSIETEALSRDLNERIDELGTTIKRREREIEKMTKRLEELRVEKDLGDIQLASVLMRYDSAFVESIRAVDTEIATYSERINSLERLSRLPVALNEYERNAGELQGKIDVLRRTIEAEIRKLNSADSVISLIASKFKEILIAVSYPGVETTDTVRLTPRDWIPMIVHGDQEWSFNDAGSGGKKTLFNVCYALALHQVAISLGLPVPSLLIIDSPTKNISQDENPDLVSNLYKVIYQMASESLNGDIQFLLIDSDIHYPMQDINGFIHRKMAGTTDEPRLISYYEGP